MYTLALIVNLCGFLWAAGIAMRLRTIQAGPLMQMPVFLLLFLAPVYVPLALLGDTLHAFARFNPRHLRARVRPRLPGRRPDARRARVRPAAARRGAASTVWAFRGLRSAESGRVAQASAVPPLGCRDVAPGPETRSRSGPRWDGYGTNFSLTSENAERVELCLFDEAGRRDPASSCRASPRTTGTATSRVSGRDSATATACTGRGSPSAATASTRTSS